MGSNGSGEDAGSAAGVAIITGGSRGIGRAIAVALAASGYDCIINYHSNASAANEVQRQVQALGRRAHTIKADIAASSDRQAIVDETVRELGRIDLLVNNAGVAPQVRADLLEATEESFDRVMSTNVKGPYFLTQLVARQMIKQAASASGSKPKIINISSISAYVASVNRGEYCVSKAGLSMATQLYAARLAEFGINVYEIRPGVIETDMSAAAKGKYDKLIFEEDLTPIHRWGRPDDVARAVVAVATDLFPFSTGEVINVDGGFHLRRL
jgi:NAD(P)-dependent dehydrogenase (short-subunit alcohol dehydrogenase family)